MAAMHQFPDLLAVNHVVIGLVLAELEHRWHMASIAVDAGAEPAGIDDDTLSWWRDAYRTYLAGPATANRVRALAPVVIAPPTDGGTRRSPAA